jgi:hypothetical protein
MLNLTIVITNKRLPQESTEQIYHRYIGLVREINSFLYAIRKPQETQPRRMKQSLGLGSSLGRACGGVNLCGADQ